MRLEEARGLAGPARGCDRDGNRAIQLADEAYRLAAGEFEAGTPVAVRWQARTVHRERPADHRCGRGWHPRGPCSAGPHAAVGGAAAAGVAARGAARAVALRPVASACRAVAGAVDAPAAAGSACRRGVAGSEAVAEVAASAEGAGRAHDLAGSTDQPSGPRIPSTWMQSGGHHGTVLDPRPGRPAPPGERQRPARQRRRPGEDARPAHPRLHQQHRGGGTGRGPDGGQPPAHGGRSPRGGRDGDRVGRQGRCRVAKGRGDAGPATPPRPTASTASPSPPCGARSRSRSRRDPRDADHPADGPHRPVEGRPEQAPGQARGACPEAGRAGEPREDGPGTAPGSAGGEERLGHGSDERI